MPAGRRRCAAGKAWRSAGPLKGVYLDCYLFRHLHLCLLSASVPVQINKWTRKVWAAVLAEFVGMAIFEIYGGNAPDSVAAYGNGITLGILGKACS